MPIDPYAVLRALVRAEAARNTPEPQTQPPSPSSSSPSPSPSHEEKPPVNDMKRG
ncbi:hypothetical protein [Streptomyces sp. S.PB5]|uniref:hypothetical protein n=1 Tax=Streptomyces sp. S.PB5 TaxID=3020844 RepID=UPI0025B219EA|nr:hypothetical protein [Streptomyces sp. S.PB5]MDN3023860.1 hypothetical protein [Streptomyces sp. S.PB5]